MGRVSGQGRPSRYTRSFGGMAGALIVTVLLVAILLVGTLWGMAPLDGNAVPGS